NDATPLGLAGYLRSHEEALQRSASESMARRRAVVDSRALGPSCAPPARKSASGEAIGKPCATGIASVAPVAGGGEQFGRAAAVGLGAVATAAGWGPWRRRRAGAWSGGGAWIGSVTFRLPRHAGPTSPPSVCYFGLPAAAESACRRSGASCPCPACCHTNARSSGRATGISGGPVFYTFRKSLLLSKPRRSRPPT